jgi:hypothetical protein
MPNPNAVVSSVIRFEPPLDRAPAELLRAERGLFVELEGGRRVRLDSADPRSVGFTQILDGLSKLRLPVYLEIDPATSVITRLLIPQLTRVVGVRQNDKGGLDVELDLSHGRHVLPRGQPDFSELERQLREAVTNRVPVILTEDDEHNIIDIRFFKPGPDVPLPPFPPEVPPLEKWPPRWIRDLLDRIWHWKWWPWCWFCCLSMTRAQQVFNAMNATSCDPLTVPPPCIPFLFPDDGCWARAHEMCRLMINMGLSPRKVWIRSSPGYWLHVNTRNNPACYVEWGWHVAPTLCVRGPHFFQTQRMVIDPSLFTTPVSKATWKGVQGDPNATLTDSDASQYWPSGGTDPTYSDTNLRLAYYRLQLQNRAIQYGPPPYANCP